MKFTGVASAPARTGDGALHRHSGLKQRMTGERFGGLDEGLVSRDRREIWQKFRLSPKIRNWFYDLSNRLSS